MDGKKGGRALHTHLSRPRCMKRGCFFQFGSAVVLRVPGSGGGGGRGSFEMEMESGKWRGKEERERERDPYPTKNTGDSVEEERGAKIGIDHGAPPPSSS